ncbi:CubicO group peptidase (beta-lactamase class C family) [Bacillus oleivorans]|uniref:CubicO group peptidase (Beta-lactamase class C family) n=1 Tax=Bacillus oleivorans TaxID=1448271 RepID=A0A285D3J9_9BACI|nr:serine hydrolase domain-containing protein [Bacillus oleivorans]SNX74397.1 CubicO group peptidase (beta-lactamase class C family) [Bacillus oleivorans]
MKKLKLCLLLLILLCIPFPVQAEDDHTTQSLRDYMEQALDDYQIPGATLAVIKDGELVFQESWGVQSDGTPVTEDTLFTIGSVSKPLTSLAIMKLAEEQTLDLDQAINTYIPSFSYDKGAFEKDITIRHLLAHTSGISSYDGLKVAELNLRGEDAISQAVAQLGTVTLRSEPGETHQYSAANYLLLGLIIEEVTNQTFADYMETEVFSELGMSKTVSTYEAASSLGYQPGFQSWFGKPVKSEIFFDDSGAPYGYITSTSNDMVKYVEFLLDGGEELLSASIFAEYISPQIHRKEDMFYGLGWRISENPEDAYYFHGGETPDSRAELFLDPDQNYGFVLLTNKNNYSEVLHTTYMREGIKAIMEGNEVPALPEASYQMQWMSLSLVIIVTLLSGWHLFHHKRKPNIRNKAAGSIGVISIGLSIAFIPVLTYIFGTPWHTIDTYAPETSLLVKLLIGVLAIHGILTLVFIRFKKGGIGFNRKAA